MNLLNNLSDGFFSDLSVLTPENITAFLRHKHNQPTLEIPAGNNAPLFDNTGAPILRKDGSQLCLPYTHACVLVYALMEAAGRTQATRTMEVCDLPLLFWRPVDVYLLTSNNRVIVGQRSNFNKNAQGLCLATAAGFPKITAEGPEAPEDTARRELIEETGLRLDEAKITEIKLFAQDPDNNINLYPIATNLFQLQGRVPTIAGKYVATTPLSDRDILEAMRPNGESLGYISLPIDRLDELETNPDLLLSVPFAPAISTLERMVFADNKRRTLADTLRKNMPLSSLREALPLVCRPQDSMACASLVKQDAAIDAIGGGLASAIQALFKRADADYGRKSPLVHMIEAARAQGFLPRQAKVMFPAARGQTQTADL